MSEQNLVPSVSITQLIARRDGIASRLQRILELVEECKQLGGGFGMRDVDDWLAGDRGTNNTVFYHYTQPEKRYDILLKRMDSDSWRFLMDQSGLYTFMDSKTRDKVRDQIREKKMPELTLDNIKSVFADLHQRRGELVVDGVENLYRQLSWDHKTNLPHMLGQKLIFNGLVSYNPRYGFSSGYTVRRELLDDLERLLYKLDDKPEPDHREAVSARFYHCLYERRAAQEMETEYFKMKWFKKGTMHLFIKDAEKVAGLNQLLASRYPGMLPEKVQK